MRAYVLYYKYLVVLLLFFGALFSVHEIKQYLSTTDSIGKNTTALLALALPALALLGLFFYTQPALKNMLRRLPLKAEGRRKYTYNSVSFLFLAFAMFGYLQTQAQCSTTDISFTKTQSQVAEERVPSGVMRFRRDIIDLGTTSGPNNDQIVGLRFKNLGIPQGSTIVSAVIEFTSGANESDALTLNIHGQAADNPALFLDNTSNISSRTNTTASVSWPVASWSTNEVGADTRTPELISIVQEIVDRPGWTDNNAMVFKFSKVSGDVRKAMSNPRLIVTYTHAVTQANVSAISPGCVNGAVVSNGKLILSSVINADRAGFSIGSLPYAGPAYAGATTIGILPFDLTSTLPNPVGSSQVYTVRLFNGSETCFRDIEITLNKTTDCEFSCDCADYLYVNDADYGMVHKFRVDPSGLPVEVGAPWFGPDSQAESPHGIAADNNGLLYVAQTSSGDIMQLDNDGNLLNYSKIPKNYFAANFASKNGYLYVYRNVPEDDRGVYMYDLCDGTLVGIMSLTSNPSTSANSWGFYIDDTHWYVLNLGGEMYSGLLDPTLYTPVPSNNGALLLDLNTGGCIGFTRDEDGNFYVVTDQNASGSASDPNITKFSPTGAFIATIEDDENTQNTGNGVADFWGARGIVYSKAAQKLYLGSAENCLSVFDKDLNQLSTLNIGNPLLGSPKGVGILRECCPTGGNTVKEVAICSPTAPTERLFLAELLACEDDGVIVGGTWMPDPANTGITFDNCNNSILVSSSTACGSFTLTNLGTGANAQCGAFSITLKISAGNVIAPVIEGDQTVCPADNPAAFMVATAASANPPSTTITYQWQQSTTSCTAGFTDISGAMSATYGSGPVSQTTYFRVIASITGCSEAGCRDTSNCVTLTLGTNCPLVPVELVRFQAQAQKDYIGLTWTTASELNNDRFEIERSEDAKSFKQLGIVKGQGTTLETTDYSFDDKTAIPGVLYYYRLKQVDVDGTFEYSELRVAQLGGDIKETLIYPNPVGASRKLNVRIYTQNARAEFVIADMQSRVSKVFKLDVPQNGWNIFELDIQDLPSGTYFITGSEGQLGSFVKTEE